MVNLSEYELRLIAKNRGIKNYKNMRTEKLLSTLNETEPNLNIISERRLNQIAKMQNLSHNDLNRITNMYSHSRDELDSVAKMRRIKNRKRMSRKELIIALLKSKRGISERFSSNLDDSKISDIRRILNRLRYVLPKKIRKKKK